MKQRVCILISLLLLAASPGLAQMAESLREEFHDQAEYGLVVINDGETGRIKGAMGDPTTRVLVLQVFAPNLGQADSEAILEWVRQGHSVWFYDARLAPMFGMKPYFLSKEQFKTKDEKGELGGHKRAGVATVGLAHRAHAVVTGCGQATIFMPELEVEGEKRYGAVEVAGDTFGVLQFSLDSPALMALRRDGKGLIVYKALLWPEVLSGDRLQSNLLEYSAGFQVPGPAGEGKVGDPPGPQAAYVEGNPAVEIGAGVPPENPGTTLAPVAKGPEPAAGKADSDLLWTLDDEQVNGVLDLKELRFETGSDSLTVPVDQVRSVDLGGRLNLDRLETVSGKIYKGMLLTPEFKLRSGNNERTFEKTDLKRIEFRRTHES
ncbi:MAG: hypothetical protein AB7S38_30480 [Vulcanimicrobiota bacterium]